MSREIIHPPIRVTQTVSRPNPRTLSLFLVENSLKSCPQRKGMETDFAKRGCLLHWEPGLSILHHYFYCSIAKWIFLIVLGLLNLSIH